MYRRLPVFIVSLYVTGRKRRVDAPVLGLELLRKAKAEELRYFVARALGVAADAAGPLVKSDVFWLEIPENDVTLVMQVLEGGRDVRQRPEPLREMHLGIVRVVQVGVVKVGLVQCARTSGVDNYLLGVRLYPVGEDLVKWVEEEEVTEDVLNVRHTRSVQPLVMLPPPHRVPIAVVILLQAALADVMQPNDVLVLEQS